MTRNETISKFMDEIKEMQNVILDNEVEILERMSEIMELMAKQSRTSAQFERATEAPAFPKVTVPSMILSILPEFNGSVFWFPQLKEKAIEKYPQFETKIRRGIHVACEQLKKNGDLLDVPGGFSVKANS